MGKISNTKHSSGSDIVSPVICIQGGGKTSQGSQGSGWNIDVCFTLNALDIHGVAYEIHRTGEPSGRFKGEDNGR